MVASDGVPNAFDRFTFTSFHCFYFMFISVTIVGTNTKTLDCTWILHCLQTDCALCAYLSMVITGLRSLYVCQSWIHALYSSRFI